METKIENGKKYEMRTFTPATIATTKTKTTSYTGGSVLCPYCGKTHVGFWIDKWCTTYCIKCGAKFDPTYHTHQSKIYKARSPKPVK